tara:strand:- start:5392 stop:5676 length:285 start_codon:yes stop_codon:yes gene_type:complete
MHDEELKQMLQEAEEELISLGVLADDTSEPYYIISGSGPAYFMDPESRQLTMTARGTEVVPIPGEADELGRILVRSPFRFLLVPEDELIDIGWN